MKITRRHALLSLTAVATAGALGVGTVGFQWWDRAPGEGLKVLSKHEYDIVQSIAEAWMPRGGTPALSGADADIGSFFDAVMDGMAPLDQKGLKLLLNVLDDGTLVTDFGAYHTLPVERRAEILHGWLHSDNNLLRSAISALLMFMGTGWTTHPDVVAVLRPMFPCGYGR